LAARDLVTVPDSTPVEGGDRTVVSLAGVSVSYGPNRVLIDVSADIQAGQITALLGTNGAGKSTLLRVVSGLHKPTAGRVLLQGEDVTGASPTELVHKGLIYIPGGKTTFPSLTVEENLRMAAYPVRRDQRLVDERFDQALELFPQLSSRLGQKGGTLSGGEQQIMALGRVIMAAPRIVLIDELSLGLAPVVLQEIIGLVGRLGELGMTILVVEQSLNIAASLAERAYFMEKGEVRFDGSIDELIGKGDLVRSVFFGRRDDAAAAG
jgi:ABC-type branched-subunit amino acid transport system ATPase component